MKRVLYQSLFLVLFLSAILTVGCRVFDYGNDLENTQTHSAATTLFGNVTVSTTALNASVLGQGAGSQPVAGAEIWIEDLPFFPHVFTDASGAYIFTNVPPGNHRVVASFTSTISKIPLKTRTSGSIVVSAQPNQAPGMTLETATNVVTGVLRDAAGQTLPAGTQIVIWGEVITVGAGGVFISPPLPGSETQSELSVLTTISSNQPAATTPASSTLTVPLVPQGTPVQIDVTVPSRTGTSTDTTVSETSGISNRPAIVSLVTRKGGLATNTIEVGGQLSFTASAVDPDSDDQGKILAVAWSLVGDGTLEAGQNNSLVATFTAPWKPGTPSVSVMVTDPRGATTTVTLKLAVVGTVAIGNPEIVLTESKTVKGGSALAISSSGDANNKVWLAPAGTTTFVESTTMTMAGGTATSINAPATEGAYKLFVVNAAGTVSNPSTATLTVDNTAPASQDTVLATSATKKSGEAVTIVSSGDVNNTVWLAPAGTTNFVEGATITKAGGTSTLINAPATEGAYKLFVVDVAGNVSGASTSTVTVRNVTIPNNQDAVLTDSVVKKGGAPVTIASSGDAGNTVWLAPVGTTNFVEGTTMTKAGGTATSINTPATEGVYKLFVVDAAGNASSPSTATLTVDNTVPAVSLQTPAANSLGTSRTADLSLTFHESMRVGTGNIVIRFAANSNVFQTIDVTDANAVSINDKVVSIKHSIFGFETKYYVTIANTCFTDAAGNAFAGYSQATDWSFTSQPGYSISAMMVSAGVATAPQAIAIDTTNNWLYLADTDSHYLHKFDLEGNKLGSVGGLGTGDSQFNVIKDVAVDSTGKIYVADKGNNKIKVFNSDLTFVAATSQQTPRRLSVGNGFLYVTTDRIGAPYKIQKRKLYADDPALAVMVEFSAAYSAFGSVGQFSDIQDIAIAPDGNIYVLDQTSNSMSAEGIGNVTIFNSGLTSETSRITGFTVPRGIEFNGGYMYIAEANEASSGKSQVKRCQLNGTVIETYTDQMSLPGAIVFDSNSNMYVPSVNGTKKILKLQKNF